MGLLGKRVADVDYTALKKRGFIKEPVEKKQPFKVNSAGLVDFTNTSTSASADSANTIMPKVASSDNSPFSFFDSIAQNAPALEITKEPMLATGNVVDSKEIQSLKIKIDDLDYKLEQFIQKMDRIESKLTEFERKTSN